MVSPCSAVAGALLSFGHKHAGAIEKAMQLYQSKIGSLYITEDSDIDNKQIASSAIEIYSDYILKGKKIPGFGHRYHNVDPRADELMNIVVKRGFIGPHIKLALALENGLTPIYCCGEALDVREAGKQNEFVINQLEETIFKLSADDFKKLVIAYEPIWAIGTGKTCDSIEANRVIAMIRNVVKQVSSEAAGEAIRILYGGSVKPSTIEEQMSQSDIDGALIGGASLTAESFNEIISNTMKVSV